VKVAEAKPPLFGRIKMPVEEWSQTASYETTDWRDSRHLRFSDLTAGPNQPLLPGVMLAPQS